MISILSFWMIAFLSCNAKLHCWFEVVLLGVDFITCLVLWHFWWVCKTAKTLYLLWFTYSSCFPHSLVCEIVCFDSSGTCQFQCFWSLPFHYFTISVFATFYFIVWLTLILYMRLRLVFECISQAVVLFPCQPQAWWWRGICGHLPWVLASGFVRSHHHQGSRTHISFGSVMTMENGIAQWCIWEGLMQRAAVILSRGSNIVVGADLEFVHKKKDVAFICFTNPM